jgi:alpha-ribazole phosphatase
MELIIRRHGKTAGNRENRYVGRTDQPLCEEYIDEIKAIGSDAAVSKVYVSPLVRTKQTARILFPNARQTEVADLREMDFGDFEGRTSDEMSNDRAYIEWVKGNCEGFCPNGESLSVFRNRICRAFEKLTIDALNYNEERLVIVAHGGTIMAVLSEFSEERKPYFEWFAANCHGFRAKVEVKGTNKEIVLRECEPI